MSCRALLAQVIYHFISGFTSKMAGTEEGITRPVAAFSACFGEPFLVWHARRIEAQNEPRREGVDAPRGPLRSEPRTRHTRVGCAGTRSSTPRCSPSG